jgi:mannonate dehydratase
MGGMAGRIRIAFGQFRELKEEDLLFARQLGASGVTLNTPLFRGRSVYGVDIFIEGRKGETQASPWAHPGRWDFMEIVQVRSLVEAYGLKLEAIENTPISFYDKALLGLPGRDEQIGNYQQIIRMLGKAGIPILGYHWMPGEVWRTSTSTPGRGGARVSSFDLDLAKEAPPAFSHPISEEQLWANYEYFIRAVLPVAEEAGVKLALHPDDPPTDEPLGGVARIMNGLKGFRRAMEIGDSPNHGLDFCVGSWASRSVGEMFDALRYFGPRGKIFYVHLRNVRGSVPRFEETFIDEGDVDVVAVLRELLEMGFEGFIIDDHVPKMVNDTAWGHRGRAFATGYIMGALRALQPHRS